MDFNLNEYPTNDVGDEDEVSSRKEAFVDENNVENRNEDCDDNSDVGDGDKDESVEEVEENVEDEQHVEHDCANFVDLLNRIDVLEMVLEVGKSVNDPEAAHILYCEYARLKGFSVTRDNKGYFNHTKICSFQTFLCSCHGRSETKTSLATRGMATYKKQDRKTMCKAKLRVARRRNQPWKVSSWYREHNHELFPSGQSYLLRSARSVSKCKKLLIEAMNSAGIGISRACAFIEKESGGPQNCGFTRKDAYNHINGLKMKTKVENGDVNSLIQYFSKMSNSEAFFYFDFQVDDEGRLMNFFFRDSRSSLDYDYFGDVLSVDSTYRTNRYKLVCVPFVGVNHHLKNVMFGIGFLSDETTRSYEWLLSTFLKSMHSKQPDIIFTDQCQSLMNAIDFVFPSASHRLCQWHINQNAPSHFGKLNGNSFFKKAWFHCMNGCDTEDEFEVTWMCMIDEYRLEENRWFNTMYGLKKSWSSVFTNQRFCAGLHATSRSEVTNKVIKNLCSASISLHDFVLKFEEVQIQWRRKEAEEDALCIGMPGLFVQNNELLNSAAKFLTRSVFRKLEHEASYSMNVDLIKGPSSYASDDIEFTVSSGNSGGNPRLVKFNRSSELASCTCRLFETAGFLCSHIFKIYYLMNVKSIPKQYLLTRLSRLAKNRISMNVDFGNAVENDTELHISSLAFVNHLMRSTYELAEYAKMHTDKRCLIMNRLASLREEVYGVAFRNPKVAKTRGETNSRIERHWDRSKGKGKEKIQKKKAGCDTRASQKRKLQHSDNVRNCTLFDMPCGSQGTANPNDTPTSPWTHSDSVAYAKIITGEEPVNPTPTDDSKGKANQQIARKKACGQRRPAQKRKLHNSDDVSNPAPFAMPSASHDIDVPYDTWDENFGWIHADSRTYVNIIDNEEPVIPNLDDDYEDLDLNFSLSRI
ncbi:protein FAR1-RELATED SEQUENCE 5-like [Salvia miltiorrhiza]|uniref:protein FAR1-RELATED SEQUENCE 5-like n=1 Tax=Salvia miltiorrhiza TaxID=226208 RepID=UPI0025AB9F9B|nr:protein FAR1-RELATED SEQUENCE 5-like [Salvia miltiorrhiza]